MTNAVCLDASIVVKWLVPEPDTRAARDLYDEIIGADIALVGPPHLLMEVCSAVYKRVRDGLIAVEDAVALIEGFGALPIQLVAPAGLYARALQLSAALRVRLPYDACYLALGELVDCAVWTADASFHRLASDRYPRLRLLSERSASA